MRRTATIIAALLCIAAADSRAVKIERNSAVLEFTYEWPAEAAAIPALDRKFQAEAAAVYRRSLSLAREDHKIYQQQTARLDCGFLLETVDYGRREPKVAVPEISA